MPTMREASRQCLGIKFEEDIKPIRLTFAFGFFNQKSELISDLTCPSIGKVFEIDCDITKSYLIRCKLINNPLTSGVYLYNMMLRNNNDVQDFIQGAGIFQIEEGDYFGTGKTIQSGQGHILFRQDWDMEPKGKIL